MKLVVSDLDGTLLDTPERLSEKLVLRLNKLIEKGMPFTVATGRDPENTFNALHGVTLRYPIILTNGALLIEPNTGNVLGYEIIEKSISDRIIPVGRKYGLSPMVYAYIQDDRPIFIKGRWWDISSISYPDIDFDARSRVISIQYFGKYNELREFYNDAVENLGNSVEILFFEDAFLDGFFWLEFNPPNAKKDVMLCRLLEILNIAPSEVMVFGDQINDLGMFRIAGISCAVDNAPAEVKKAADYIVASNKQGGVVGFLEKNFEKFFGPTS